MENTFFNIPNFVKGRIVVIDLYHKTDQQQSFGNETDDRRQKLVASAKF